MDYSVPLADVTVSQLLLALAAVVAVYWMVNAVVWGVRVLGSMFGAAHEPDEAQEADADDYAISDSVCGYCGQGECWGECRDNGSS